MMFRKLNLVYLFQIILCNTLLSAQNIETVVKNSQQNYKEISTNINKYSTERIGLFENSTEGGNAIGYFEKSELKFIKANWLGETGKKVTEFYFKQAELFFVLEKTYTYNRPIYWDTITAKKNNDDEVFDLKKSKITENRVYFDNGKIVFWLNENQHTIRGSKKAFAAKENEITIQSRRLQKRLKKLKNAD